ncbi:hypothetical protein EVG20_g6799 [Dentipellis fragilis]|uniref:Cytochrome P450 n=1 Tax=Dentipellis fragilis TaxID=205917 RepID=A0A4Y9YI06_9AGAM|nr:hypothetical protein EVG20_g6799 [Dentipellis fragilis]
MPSLPSVVAVLSAILTLAVAHRLWHDYSEKHKHTRPPGPSSLPILGSALHIPKERPWLAFARWQKPFGEIIQLTVFSRNLVVINSYQLTMELFDKRSALYSDRPRRPMAELCGFGSALLFQNYNSTARQARKLMHSELSVKGTQPHRVLQESEARAFARRVLDDPASFRDHLRRATASSLLAITYGHTVENDDDHLVSLSELVMNSLAEVITPNRFLVDSLPFLKYVPASFPGAAFQRTAQTCKRNLYKFMDLPFAEVKKKVAEGFATPSFTSNHLQGRVDSISQQEEEVLKWTAGGIFAAGSDTTISVLTSFILAMLLHPKAQAKAQAEIDSLLGPNTLPTFHDRERLPYVECIIKEVLRWNPAAPLVAHTTRMDDEINGYRIKAGSVVMANIWAFTHDPSMYSSPSEFNPDRFMHHPDDPTRIPPPDPRSYVFGFGRRSCPGINLADALVYIMVVTTLAVFDISPALDENQMPIIPEVEYSTGAVSHPRPFRCNITPRSQNAAMMIKYATEA